MIAIKSGGLCCGCGGAAPCPVHGTAQSGAWEIRGVPARQLPTTSPQNLLPLGADASGVGAWSQKGEVATPFSGALPVTPLSWDHSAMPPPASQDTLEKWYLPPWASRSYTLTGVSVGVDALTFTVSVDHAHTFNGPPDDPAAASWNAFFDVAAGAYALGSMADYTSTAAQPQDTVDGVLFADLPLGVRHPTVALQRTFNNAPASVTLSLRLVLDAASPRIELVSVDGMVDATGAVVVGGSLDHPFPVSIASDEANVAHNFTAPLTIRDSGGVAVGNVTASGFMRRRAWGAVTQATASESSAVDTPTPTASNASRRTLISNVLDLDTLPRPLDLEPITAHPDPAGLAIPFIAPYSLRLWVITKSVKTEFASSPVVTQHGTATVSADLAGFPAAPTEFPDLVASGYLAATVACPGISSHSLSIGTVRPLYASLVDDGVDLGTGRDAQTPAQIASSPDGSWVLSFVTTADVNLTSKYPGFDSVILPAGTPFTANMRGNLKAAWRGGVNSLRTSGFVAVAVTLNTVVGGVPGTLADTINFIGKGTSANLPASPVYGFFLGRSGWGAFFDAFGTAGALSLSTAANKTAAGNLSLISTAHFDGLARQGVAALDHFWSGTTVDGAAASIGADIFANTIETGVYAYDNRTGQPGATREIMLGLSTSAFVLTTTGQGWVPEVSQSITLNLGTDPTKRYGLLRTVKRGCPLASSCSAWATIDYGPDNPESEPPPWYHQFQLDGETGLTLFGYRDYSNNSAGVTLDTTFDGLGDLYDNAGRLAPSGSTGAVWAAGAFSGASITLSRDGIGGAAGTIVVGVTSDLIPEPVLGRT